MRPYIKFNGRRSDELGLVITDIKRTKAAKKRVTASVPYSSVVHDFSRAAGKYAYGERTDAYTFALKASTPKELENKISEVSAWLLEAPRGDMWDSSFEKRHFFLSSCTELAVNYASPRAVRLTAKFSSYAYMIEDNTRPAYYTATAQLTAYTYELSVADKYVPYFSTTAACTVRFEGVDYSIPANSQRYRISDIVFERGVNLFSLMGSGELTIETFKEVL